MIEAVALALLGVAGYAAVGAVRRWLQRRWLAQTLPLQLVLHDTAHEAWAAHGWSMSDAEARFGSFATECRDSTVAEVLITAWEHCTSAQLSRAIRATRRNYRRALRAAAG